MSRKDYIAIAAILKRHNEGQPKVVGSLIYKITADVASYLSGDNPNFDQSRFFKACGF